MSNTTRRFMMGAAGAAGESTYVDDVFSQYIWDGNATAGRSINNGIDFAGEGGMIWIKTRNQGWSHRLWDTVRGATKFIYSSEPHAEATDVSGAANMLTSFDSNGVTLGQDSNAGGSNYSGANYISWSFRKAPKFFDVVTYTGTGVTRTVDHNLGSVPGMILVKRIDSSHNWGVYHRGLNDGVNPERYRQRLNIAGSEDGNNDNGASYWANTAPTSTNFTVSGPQGGYINTNVSGASYVAYLFAHNDGDGEFGEGGDKDIIKCTTYTGTSSGGQYVNLGWEPQWLLVKATDGGSGGGDDWYIFDAMRGLRVAAGDNPYLQPNDNAAEYAGVSEMYRIDATGFTVDPGGTNYMNSNGRRYIVVAIRRSDGVVGKPPTVGTDAFAMDTGAGSATMPNFDSGFPVDLSITRAPASSTSWETGGRLIQGRWLATNSTGAQSPAAYFSFDSNTGWMDGASAYNSTYQSWMWKRHAGFDVVTYTGNGSLRTISHSMGRAPEMMWFKKRNDTKNWYVYHKGLDGGSSPQNYSLRLNTTAAEDQDGNTLWNQTVPTSSVFTINTDNGVNNNGDTYIAMLFASIDGISKVGSYIGSNSSQTISLGFQPRFFLLKNIDAGEYWYLGDSVRGLDNRLAINNSNPQSTMTGSGGVPWLQATSSGVTIIGNELTVNQSGSNYIYYAHA